MPGKRSVFGDHLNGGKKHNQRPVEQGPSAGKAVRPEKPRGERQGKHRAKRVRKDPLDGERDQAFKIVAGKPEKKTSRKGGQVGEKSH